MPFCAAACHAAQSPSSVVSTAALVLRTWYSILRLASKTWLTAGEASAAKTQLCLQLLLCAQLPVDQGGLDGSALCAHRLLVCVTRQQHSTLLFTALATCLSCKRGLDADTYTPKATRPSSACSNSRTQGSTCAPCSFSSCVADLQASRGRAADEMPSAAARAAAQRLTTCLSSAASPVARSCCCACSGWPRCWPTRRGRHALPQPAGQPACARPARSHAGPAQRPAAGASQPAPIKHHWCHMLHARCLVPC
jgi:hypothetical protein